MKIIIKRVQNGMMVSMKRNVLHKRREFIAKDIEEIVTIITKELKDWGI